MPEDDKFTKVIIGLVLVLTLAAVCFGLVRSAAMDGKKYTLETYTGVGSGVYKHGTIVKVVDGQPVVVGHFDDDSGAEYPGTVEIKEVQ